MPFRRPYVLRQVPSLSLVYRRSRTASLSLPGRGAEFLLLAVCGPRWVKMGPSCAANLCIDVVGNTTPTHRVAKKRPIFSLSTKALASVSYFTRSNTSEPRLSGEPGKFTAACHIDVT